MVKVFYPEPKGNQVLTGREEVTSYGPEPG